MIDAIGVWMLSRSCRDRGRWMEAHPGAPLDVAVNVSARQLLGTDFTRTVADVLAASGMDPRALVLEVTESIFIEEGQRALAALADLKSLGVRLALDDFGTGYSSLSYLLHLPVDIVKIDRSFVSGMSGSGRGRSIVESVTTMAHALDLTVTAEGVETEQQANDVDTIGCELAQGYYYARPMAASAIADHLREQRTTAGLMTLPSLQR